MKVLLVDDDQLVRTVCSNMLEAMEHDVLTAQSGDEAIHILQHPDASFDVMLIDDSMPELDGLATLQKLSLLGLRLKVILISGGNASLDRYNSCGNLKPVGILAKPFSLKRLSDALSLPAK